MQFELHETFANPKRVINSKPGAEFEIKSIGWGYFMIPVTVTWNPAIGMPQQTLEVNHMLSFERDDTFKKITIRFKRDKIMPLLYPN